MSNKNSRALALLLAFALGDTLHANYIFPDVAKRVSKALKAKDAKGGYAAATDAEAFSVLLSKDMRALGKDGHFRVGHAPGYTPHPTTLGGPAPPKELLEQLRLDLTRPGYGVQRMERLDGNVGYLELREYDFQTQKRAILVGESTGGGANPGDDFSITHDFVAFIPTGQSINPITHTNWEHVGVKPDIAVPAADALKTAHAASLRTLAAASRHPEEREYLQDTLRKVETGVVDAPRYTAHP